MAFAHFCSKSTLRRNLYYDPHGHRYFLRRLRQSLNSYSVPVLPSTLNNPEQPLPSPFSVNLLPSNPRRSTWERGRQHTTGVKNNGLGLVTVGSGFKFMANSGWEGYLQNENGIHHQATCGVTGNMKLYEDVSS
jgi:hypothetical protein